jgi:hypothetical protein
MGMHGPLRRALAIGVVSFIALGGCMDAPAGVSPTIAGTPAALPTPAATATVLWPAPADPMGLARAAGLQPEPKEIFVTHVHAHLDVFVDGVAVLVPAGIGINIDDPGVHSFAGPGGAVGYGGIELCDAPCISPLHTHDPDGILHTESGSIEPNTLAQFFTEWDVTLSADCVGDFCAPDKPIAFYVDGEAFTGDPRTIELADLAVIVIAIGTPPAVIPSTFDFSNA